jgi:hypothetical protein
MDVFSLNGSRFLIHEEFKDTGSGARAFGGKGEESALSGFFLRTR